MKFLSNTKNMMLDNYSLSIRRARIARLAAMVFVLIGTISAVGPVAIGMRPGLSVDCGPAAGCVDRVDLIGLAPDDQRAVLSRSPVARAHFSAHVARPLVRVGLAATNLLGAMPFAGLMICVGLGLARLAGRRGNDLARALPWLRRAAFAALLLVIAGPVADSLRAMILYPGTPAGATWFFTLEFRSATIDLLLALAVFAVVWTLDAGSRAARDVAAFV